MGKFLLAIAAAAAVIILVEYVFPGIKYKLRKNYTKTRLSMLPRNEYIVLSDIKLRSRENSVAIDHVICSKYGIFVIQEKPYGGRIFGKATDPYWTRLIGSKETKFRNPLAKCRLQLEALSSLLDLDLSAFIPIIVFSGGGSSWAETSVPVVSGTGMMREIKSRTKPILDENTIQNAAIKLTEY